MKYIVNLFTVYCMETVEFIVDYIVTVHNSMCQPEND